MYDFGFGSSIPLIRGGVNLDAVPALLGGWGGALGGALIQNLADPIKPQT